MPYAKLEPSGSGVVKDVAKLRVDLFLNPDDPHYDKHYVRVPVIPPEGYPGKVDKEGTPKNQKDYEAWLESLPHIWINTPFHHNKIWLPDAGATDNLVLEKMEHTLNYFYTFHQHCWDTGVPFIENWKKVPKVKGGIRDVFVKGNPLEVTACEVKIADVLSRVQEFQIGVSIVPPTDLNIGEKGTIDVGSLLETGNSYLSLYFSQTSTYYTGIDYSNAANADGILDTVVTYGDANTRADNSIKFGTFIDNGSNNFTCHDAEEYGEISVGYNSCTGLSIAVSTGEFIGADARAAIALYLERNTSGGGGIYTVSGQFCDPNDTSNYNISSDDTLSLYGTGTEAGGEQELTAVAVDAASSVQTPSISGSGTAPLTASPVAAASSIQISAIAGSGNAPLTASPVAVVSSVVNAGIENVAGIQTLIASPVAVTSSVSQASISGSGIAPLTATVAVVASSVQVAVLSGSGNAPLTAASIQVASSVQVSTIAGTGTAPLTSSSVAVTSSVQAGVLAGSGSAPLTASPIAVITSVSNGTIENVAVPQELLASPVAVAALVQASVIAGTGIAGLQAASIAVASSVVASACVTSCVLIVLSTGLAASRLEANRVAPSRLGTTRLSSSRLPLSRRIWRCD